MNKNTKLFISCAFITTAVALPSLGFSSWKTKSQSKDFGISSSDKKNTKPVAYIKGQETIKYTTIEKALEVAGNNNANNTIYVIPGTEPTITGECIVAANDTLIFPYDGTTWEEASRNTVQNDYFADGNESLVEANRKNLVTLDENAHLINNGTIYVGGILGTSVSGSRQRPTGHTTGSYVELLMSDGSQITNKGNITCYGYIKSKNRHDIDDITQPFINNIGSNASMNLPLCIYDFRGATYALSAYHQKIMPFNIFDFPNSQVKMNFDSLSKFNTTVSMYSDGLKGIGAGVQTTNLNLIGATNAIFKINSGEVSMQYTPSESNFGYTTNDVRSDTPISSLNTTKINLNGDISFSSAQLTLAGRLDVNTADFIVPFSYKFQIHQLSGITSIDNKVKFLAGTTYTVNPSATLNINNLSYFYINYIDEVTYATNSTIYPKAVPQASLVNNGIVNINSNFAGKITSNIANSLIVISSSASTNAISQELITANMKTDLFHLGDIDYSYINISGNAYGSISDNQEFSNPSEKVFLNSTNYTSNNNGVWFGTKSNQIPEENKSSSSGEFNAMDLLGCFDENTTLLTNKGKVNIKFIHENDLVLAYDHFTGKLNFQPVAVKINHGLNKYFHILLEFTQDISFGIVQEHGLFCFDEKKYVSINKNNYKLYLGKEFAIFNENKLKKVRLLKAKGEEKITNSYTIITYSSFNCVANKLLNVTNVLYSLYNLYSYDEKLIYNQEEILESVNKYGIFKYADLKPYFSNYVYNAFNLKYYKALVSENKTSIAELCSYLELLKDYKSLGHIEIDKITGSK